MLKTPSFPTQKHKMAQNNNQINPPFNLQVNPEPQNDQINQMNVDDGEAQQNNVNQVQVQVQNAENGQGQIQNVENDQMQIQHAQNVNNVQNRHNVQIGQVQGEQNNPWHNRHIPVIKNNNRPSIEKIIDDYEITLEQKINFLCLNLEHLSTESHKIENSFIEQLGKVDEINTNTSLTQNKIFDLTCKTKNQFLTALKNSLAFKTNVADLDHTDYINLIRLLISMSRSRAGTYKSGRAGLDDMIYPLNCLANDFPRKSENFKKKYLVCEVNAEFYETEIRDQNGGIIDLTFIQDYADVLDCSDYIKRRYKNRSPSPKRNRNNSPRKWSPPPLTQGLLGETPVNNVQSTNSNMPTMSVGPPAFPKFNWNNNQNNQISQKNSSNQINYTSPNSSSLTAFNFNDLEQEILDRHLNKLNSQQREQFSKLNCDMNIILKITKAIENNPQAKIKYAQLSENEKTKTLKKFFLYWCQTQINLYLLDELIVTNVINNDVNSLFVQNGWNFIG